MVATPEASVPVPVLTLVLAVVPVTSKVYSAVPPEPVKSTVMTPSPAPGKDSSETRVMVGAVSIGQLAAAMSKLLEVATGQSLASVTVTT